MTKAVLFPPVIPPRIQKPNLKDMVDDIQKQKSAKFRFFGVDNEEVDLYGILIWLDYVYDELMPTLMTNPHLNR